MSNNERFLHPHDGGTLVSANEIRTRLSDNYWKQWMDDEKFRAAELANRMLCLGLVPTNWPRDVKIGPRHLYEEPRPIPGDISLFFSSLQLVMWDNEDESDFDDDGKRVIEDFLVTAREKFYRVNRLFHVLQLSAKSAHQSEKADFESPLDHTRGGHTFLVAALVMYVLQVHNLHPLLEVSISSVINHDIATTALGDPVMALDQDNLNEEDHWMKMMKPEGWQFLKDRNISSQDIDDIIHTDRTCPDPTLTMLKALLNVCDRAAYVCDDAYKIYMQIRGTRINAPTPIISKTVEQMPHIGEIFRCIRIQGEKVYIDNPTMAKDFLWLRAVMFRYCYYYPENNSRDVLITKAVEPIYKSGVLTPDMLRNFTDDQLLSFVVDTYGVQGDLLRALREWESQYVVYRTDEELEQEKAKLIQKGYLILGHSVPRRPFKPGTDLLVEVDDGTGPKIMTMAEHSPGFDAKIKALANEIAWQGQIFYMRPDDHTKGADMIRELFLAVDRYQRKTKPAKPKTK